MGHGLKIERPTGSGSYEQLVNYTMLYDEGDECTDITGGWIQASHSSGSTSSLWGTITRNASNIGIAMTPIGGVEMGLCPQNMINMSEYVMFGANVKCSGSIGDTSIGYSTSPYASGYGPAYLAKSNGTADTISSPTLDTLFMHFYNVLSSVTAFPVVSTWVTNSSLGSLALFSAMLLKADDWQMLCDKAGITAPSTVASLVADSTKLNAILSNKDAVNYMVAQCTGDFMASAMASSTFLTALNSSPYKTTVQANEHWAKFLLMVA